MRRSGTERNWLAPLTLTCCAMLAGTQGTGIDCSTDGGVPVNVLTVGQHIADGSGDRFLIEADDVTLSKLRVSNSSVGNAGNVSNNGGAGIAVVGATCAVNLQADALVKIANNVGLSIDLGGDGPAANGWHAMPRFYQFVRLYDLALRLRY
jgi:hypothetical protein